MLFVHKLSNIRKKYIQNFTKTKKGNCQFLFFGEMAKPIFNQISTERRAPTVHRTGGAFFRLFFVENVRRQNVKPVFSQDYNRATRSHRRADGAFFRLLVRGKVRAPKKNQILTIFTKTSWNEYKKMLILNTN